MIALPLFVFVDCPGYRPKEGREPGAPRLIDPTLSQKMGKDGAPRVPIDDEKERQTEFGLQARQLSFQ